MQKYKILATLTDLFAYAVLFFIPFYIIISVFDILSSPNLQIVILNILLLVIEIFGLIFSFYLVDMIGGSFFYRGGMKSAEEEGSEKPFFSIIVPSHGTPFSILEKTLNGVLNLASDNYEIVVSDNGKNRSVTQELQKFCKQNGIDFYHKKDKRGFKAGNINAVFSLTKGDFIVILDSDHIPVSNLLQKFSSIMKDPKIGFIQAKVSYRNIHRLYQKANSILYSQFYEVIEAAKDRRGMVLFNGTTGCFRRSVLGEIGGFAEDTLIEDIDTSMQIIARGYKGRYINFIGSYGLVPATAKAQLAQLWRWTHGACNILRIRLRLLLTTPHIGWFKKFELILNTMAFFSGISIVLFFSVLGIMINLDTPILRYSFFGLNTIYVMPLLVSISYTIIALLAIMWEEREDPFLVRIIHLVPFYLFSLGSFLFLISGVLEGLLLYNTPRSETGVWDRKVNILRNSVLALFYTGFIISLAFLALPNEYSYFILGGTITWVFAPCMLIWEEIFPPKVEN
ncbi:MAG: glycosyltransferase family 2 protein [Candidatus Hodarchaeales archaeon]|jgi:cellulose synthase (UDP-forming)